jgi:hypothetical protein
MHRRPFPLYIQVFQYTYKKNLLSFSDMQMRALPSLLAALVALTLCLAGCKSRYDKSNSKDGVIEQLEQSFHDAERTVRGYTPDSTEMTAAAQKQFQDMLSFEYRVIEVDNSLSAEKLQDALARLGSERWECFNILDRGASYMVSCRRRPISLLHYVLRYLPSPFP